MDEMLKKNPGMILMRPLPGGEMWYYDIVEKRMRITDNLDDIKWAYDEEGRIYTNDSKG